MSTQGSDGQWGSDQDQPGAAGDQPAPPPPPSGGWGDQPTSGHVTSEPVGAQESSWGTAPAPVRGTNGLAVAALVIGILGLVFFWTIIGGALGGILAIIFGILGIRRSSTVLAGKGMSIAGIVTGALGLIGAIVAGVAGAWIINLVFGEMAEFEERHPECVTSGTVDPTADCQQLFEEFLEERMEDRFGG